jgi:hypothetical protein
MVGCCVVTDGVTGREGAKVRGWAVVGGGCGATGRGWAVIGGGCGATTRGWTGAAAAGGLGGGGATGRGWPGGGGTGFGGSFLGSCGWVGVGVCARIIGPSGAAKTATGEVAIITKAVPPSRRAAWR